MCQIARDLIKGGGHSEHDAALRQRSGMQFEIGLEVREKQRGNLNRRKLALAYFRFPRKDAGVSVDMRVAEPGFGGKYQAVGDKRAVIARKSAGNVGCFLLPMAARSLRRELASRRNIQAEAANSFSLSMPGPVAWVTGRTRIASSASPLSAREQFDVPDQCDSGGAHGLRVPPLPGRQ